MRRFRNILVAVDLSRGDRLVSDILPAPSIEAIERALWLAKRNSARLTYFFALDLPPTAIRSVLASDSDKETVLDEAQIVLKGLASRAIAEGVDANIELRFGKSWHQIILQVLRNEHDLVVAGTRHRGSWEGFLMGSTGTKLLRKCPCPVWITQPQAEREIKAILVAHDLRPVGDLAMELGGSMAEIHGAQLHVLHSLDLAEPPDASLDRMTLAELARRRSAAETYIREQLTRFALAKPPQVHIGTDPPALEVLKHIDRSGIELLVMGTIARTGIPGLLVGNTAERLLPQIPCSILAVKPKGFVPPIAL